MALTLNLQDLQETYSQGKDAAAAVRRVPNPAVSGISISPVENQEAVAASPLTEQQQPSIQSAQPSPPVPSNMMPVPGAAIVDGKRINYADIGTKADPLSRSGGYVMAGPAAGGLSVGNGTPADPNVGAADREYDRQVRQAQTVQDQLNLSGIGVMDPDAARQSIMARQSQQNLDQRGAADMAEIGLKGELALQRNAFEQSHLGETSRHNMAMEGLKKSEIEKTGVDAKDTDMIRNMNYLVKSGVAKDAKDAHAILNGKKGGRDDFVSRLVEQRVANATKNGDDINIDAFVTDANAAADKLFPRSAEDAATPKTESRTDAAVLFPPQQGITVETPITNRLRESGIKAKRPSLNSFYQ